ncbi:E3 SUMO-protein ligase PIAS4 [Intoshia linei]|uniref:E3 SUMO-protein ligase PIAS4 n=1 Tax=Intoshia linei TaxID=1819745 RepID=A0A177AYW9_9BILA|nr:E3 SUMO-protein ligase PIAS4 [Intoshia linei]
MDSFYITNHIMKLKISGLVNILNFANRKRTGNKNELQKRVLALVDMEQDIIRRSALLHAATGPTSQSLNAGVCTRHEAKRPKISTKHLTDSVNVESKSEIIPCYLISLPFFKTISTIMPPKVINPGIIYEDCVTKLFFNIPDPLLLQHISDDIENYQIQLRICQARTIAMQKDHFPFRLQVRVNQHEVKLPAAKPSHRQGVESEIPAIPLNITSFINQSTLRHNEVELNFLFDKKDLHCASVYFVKKYSSNDLIQFIKSKEHVTLDGFERLAKEKFHGDRDIILEKITATVICPLTKQKMTLPCRSTSCTHLQCFDAITFTQMNEVNAKWLCPICHQYIFFDTIAIDDYFINILKKVESGVEEVDIFPNVEWKALSGDEYMVLDSSDDNEEPDAANIDFSNVPEEPTDLDIIMISSSDDESIPPLRDPITNDDDSKSLSDGDRLTPDFSNSIVSSGAVLHFEFDKDNDNINEIPEKNEPVKNEETIEIENNEDETPKQKVQPMLVFELSDKNVESLKVIPKKRNIMEELQRAIQQNAQSANLQNPEISKRLQSNPATIDKDSPSIQPKLTHNVHPHQSRIFQRNVANKSYGHLNEKANSQKMCGNTKSFDSVNHVITNNQPIFEEQNHQSAPRRMTINNRHILYNCNPNQFMPKKVRTFLSNRQYDKSHTNNFQPTFSNQHSREMYKYDTNNRAFLDANRTNFGVPCQYRNVKFLNSYVQVIPTSHQQHPTEISNKPHSTTYLFKNPDTTNFNMYNSHNK